MTSNEFLSPLLLAEQIPKAELEAALAAQMSRDVPDSPTEELGQDYWLGGLNLDLALHPDTKARAAEDCFEDAGIHWQRVLDHPYDDPKTLSIRTATRQLLAQMPASRARRLHFGSKDPADYLSTAEWDAMNLEGALALEAILDRPDIVARYKSAQAARIGTQLICSRGGILALTSTGRESMMGRRDLPNDLRNRGHPLYTIGEDDMKIPMQVRVRQRDLPDDDYPHVRVLFGNIAQNTLRGAAPDIAEDQPNHSQSTLLVARWCIKMAKKEDLLPHELRVIDGIADNIIGRIDRFEAEAEDYKAAGHSQ